MILEKKLIALIENLIDSTNIFKNG